MNRRVGNDTRRHLEASRPAVWWRRRFRVAKPLLLRKTPLKLPQASIWDTEFEVAARCRLAAFHLCSRRAPISTSVTQPRSITKNGGTRREGHVRRRGSEFNFGQPATRWGPISRGRERREQFQFGQSLLGLRVSFTKHDSHTLFPSFVVKSTLRVRSISVPHFPQTSM